MYKFYIDDWEIPLTPSEITIDRSGDVEQLELVDGAIVTRHKTNEPLKVAFTITISYYVAQYELTHVREAFEKKERVFLQVNRYSHLDLPSSSTSGASIFIPPFAGYFYIESMSDTESADNGSDVEVSFSFVEAIDRKTQRISANAVISTGYSNRKGLDLSEVPEGVMASGDESYADLAREFYKNDFYATTIQTLNPDIVDASGKPYGVNCKLPKGEIVQIKETAQ